MTPFFQTDSYDASRPLGLPLAADVVGILWRSDSATLLRVPHESLVADVPMWLAAEANHRASRIDNSIVENFPEDLSPEQGALIEVEARMRLHELTAICSALAKGNGFHADLPLGIHSRVASEPWIVDSSESMEIFVKSLVAVSRVRRSFVDGNVHFILDARPRPRIYVSNLLRYHALYSGSFISASVTSENCLQSIASARRLTEDI